MSPLEEIILEEIRRAGSMTVARYMELALYHPDHGYYGSGAPRTGWEGDFITSPQLDPSFGWLWARGLAEIWDLCGRPDPFTVIEVGPGEGGMATAVLKAASGAFAEALRLVLVEPHDSVRARQTSLLGGDERVSWSSSLEAAPRAAGAVLANEILDNQPVHVIEKREGAVREVMVAASGNRLEERLEDVSPEIKEQAAALTDRLEERHRAEVRIADETFVETAASKIERGAVIFIDYGDETGGLLKRSDGTLVCYGRGAPDERFLVDPGKRDITAHVDWTLIRAAIARSGMTASGPHPQREVLSALGAPGLDERFRTSYESAISSGRGADALGLLSRRQALGALMDISGLGGLGVMCGLRDIPPPSFLL
jgi:SAM-dependent MidA family methyltransferase